MKNLLNEISKCTLCQKHLKLGPRPVLSMSSKSKILIIGQAPGLTVHKTGKPWDDKSGENLRNWMGINDKVFYDNKKIGIMPMGFCYPGKGKSGDLPPRKECAPEWHEKLLDKLDTPSLILLIGSYAQNYYLGKKKLKTLTDTVKNYHQFLPKYFVLPHPSPRNNTWMKKNPWFKNEVIPTLKNKVLESLSA